MNPFKIFMILLAIPVVGNAQWSYNGSNIYYNNGNIGIGTSAPSNMQGWDKVLDLRGGPHSKILASSNSGSFITAMYSHVSWMGGGGFIGTESNHNLYFNTSYDPKMVLTTAGNLGVGLFSPSQRVDVLGRVKFRASNGTSAGAWFTDEAGNETAFVGQLGSLSSDPLGFWHGGAWRFTVAQNGNVGIGTTSANSKLYVDVANINPDVPAITIGNTESGKNYSGVFEFRSPTTTAPFYIYTWDDELQFSQRNSNGSYKSQFMKFHNQTGHVTFPNASGNVGIGTDTPDSKLTVKGIIHTQEVKVDLNGSVAPDYVFEKDYPLTSLEELKSYIDQNKHLPEIPSAKVMEEEGVNLKEMNLLLLKKVEELTLHLLNQEDEIESLKQKVNILSSRIDH